MEIGSTEEPVSRSIVVVNEKDVEVPAADMLLTVTSRSKPLIWTPVAGVKGLVDLSSRRLMPCESKGSSSLKAIEKERDSPKLFSACAAVLVAPSTRLPESLTPS